MAIIISRIEYLGDAFFSGCCSAGATIDYVRWNSVLERNKLSESQDDHIQLQNLEEYLVPLFFAPYCLCPYPVNKTYSSVQRPFAFKLLFTVSLMYSISKTGSGVVKQDVPATITLAPASAAAGTVSRPKPPSTWMFNFGKSCLNYPTFGIMSVMNL